MFKKVIFGILAVALMTLTLATSQARAWENGGEFGNTAFPSDFRGDNGGDFGF